MPEVLGALYGTVTLVVEDDPFVAKYVARVIQAAGGEVLGPFSLGEVSPNYLTDLATLPHAAVLNARLAEVEMNEFSVADRLAARSVPLIFSADHVHVRLPHRFDQRPLIPKPFAAYQIVAELKKIKVEALQRNALLRPATLNVMRGH
jgi:hypothetical protein